MHKENIKRNLVAVLVIWAFLLFPATSLAAEISGALSVGVPTLSIGQQIALLQAEILRLQTLIAQLLAKPSLELNAGAYLIMDTATGEVVAQKNAGAKYPIASVTKLMNAVVALENIPMENTITLTPEILSPEGYSPALYLGLTVTAENLLKAALIQSTNDAANALAYFVGKERFVALMNQKAKGLGMADTAFVDPHGLAVENKSSANDLAKLVAYIQKNHPEIFTITKDNNFWMPDPTGRMLKFKNVSNFFDNPDFIGAKTGYTLAAKQAVAGLAHINNRTLALVVLSSANRTQDALNLITLAQSAP